MRRVTLLYKTSNMTESFDILFERYFPQERSYDCGPTCIKMILAGLNRNEDTSISDIVELCGSDDILGTDDKRMCKGMNALNLHYIIGSKKTTKELVEELKNHYIILRTLTKGIKHWIVVYDYIDGKFLVNDPWLGQIKYNDNQLLAIWKPRDYFYFAIPRINS